MSEDAKAIDAAKERLDEGLGKAKERLEGAARSAGKKARQISEAAQERYGEAMGQLREGYTRVRRDAADWSDDLADYVRDNPGKAVAIAAICGFFLGLLFRREGSE